MEFNAEQCNVVLSPAALPAVAALEMSQSILWSDSLQFGGHYVQCRDVLCSVVQYSVVKHSEVQ